MHVIINPPAHEIELNVDPDRIRQVIANLLENSWRYTDENGEVELSVHITDELWQLHVDDSPPGISDDELKRLGYDGVAPDKNTGYLMAFDGKQIKSAISD